MNGETDLPLLLKGLAPVVDQTEYVFASMPHDRAVSYRDVAWMSCREREGTTLILHVSDDLPAGLGDIGNCPRFRRITLQVHSSLQAVGLTAAVSAALAAADIPANMVAGFYHDYVFVPVEKATQALDVLMAISSRA